MITIVCPICKEENSEEVFGLGDLDKPLRNVICRSCGLVYINPRPSADEYLSYQGKSGKGSGHHSASSQLIEEKIKGDDLKIKSKVLDYLLPYIKPGARVLDIGTGFGTLLHFIREKTGALVDGIEINQRDVEMARQKFNLQLFSGTLEEYERQGRELYDLIILHHTFEHLADPLGALQSISKLLQKDGLLYIAIPNILNIKKRPEIFFQLGHAFTYSPASIRKMLASGSFKIYEFNTRAAYPGGMELIAARNDDGREALVSREISAGENWQEVKKYVERKQHQFDTLRNLRERILFWLPKELRIRIGRAIYLTMKK